jgi:hypothetical protein
VNVSGDSNIFCDSLGSAGRGFWNGSVFMLSICNISQVTRGVVFSFSISVRNPHVASGLSQPGVIQIACNGNTKIGAADMISIHRAMSGVPNGSIPLFFVIPSYLEKRIGQTNPLQLSSNILSVTLASNCNITKGSEILFHGLSGVDSSRDTFYKLHGRDEDFVNLSSWSNADGVMTGSTERNAS